MAVKYLAGDRLIGTAAERAAMTTSASAIPQNSWKEIARTTLGSASSTFNTSTFTGKKYLWVQIYGSRSSGSDDGIIRFNSDSGSNYARRFSTNGGSDGTGASATSISNMLASEGNRDPFYSNSFIINKADKEKFIISNLCFVDSGAGAGNAPSRRESANKWTNTSDQITSIQVSGGTFDAGSEIVVLGCDDDEADSGTNYWQELAVKELSSTGDTIDSGTITAKKYLKVAISINATSAVRTQFQFNSDTGSNYANRNEKNGASDSTNPGMGRIYLNDLERSSDGYAVAYIINVADREKLLIYHDVWQNSTGASNIPDRTETVAKWANTSNQITSIQLLNDKAGDFASGSFIRIWGAD